ncbi:MAG: hypothetical protein IJO85_02725 [Lachnospiraceae bacterium]|nr:hypothetical protein [Lachnospiraceae bacterium]
MQRDYRKIILNIFLIFTVAIGCLVRIYMCICHFTTCDDLGVAMSMLRGQSEEWSIKNSIEGFLSFRAFGWTYAPLQFVVTSILLSPQYSYLQTIVMGRIPSLFFGIVSLLILYKLCEAIWQDNEQVRGKQARICSLILLATSFENIIYSSQMESYTIGVVAVLICLFLLIVNVEDFKFIYTTLLITLLCYAQYQLFIFVFCFYVVMFFKYIRIRKTCLKIVLSGMLAVLLNIPNLLSFFSSGMSARGLNWNTGIQGQYIYDITLLENWGSIVNYTIEFFVSNVIQCYKYLLLPCKYDTIATFFAIILVVFSLVGLIGLHKGNRIQRDIGHFIDVVLGLYLVFLIKGILTLSPSRHLLVMVPIMLICICGGFIVLLNKLANIKYCDLLCYLYYIVIIGLFILELPNQINIRTNRFSEKYFEDILNEYKPDIVITYGYSMDPYLFENSGYVLELDDNLCEGIIYKKDLDIYDESDKKVVFFSNNSICDEDYYAREEKFLQTKLREIGYMYEYQLIQEGINEERWGATQEYAGEFFFNNYYGEYVYEYRLIPKSLETS